MHSYVITVAAVTTATLTILGALGYLLFPRCKTFIWTVIETDPARYDQVRLASMKRMLTDQNAALREALKPELELLKANSDKLASHEADLQFVKNAVVEQGKEIKQLPLIARAIEQSAEAQKEMSATLKEIHTGMMDHSRRMERWEGYMEGQRDGPWDGKTERRGRGRRRADGT